MDLIPKSLDDEPMSAVRNYAGNVQIVWQYHKAIEIAIALAPACCLFVDGDDLVYEGVDVEKGEESVAVRVCAKVDPAGSCAPFSVNIVELGEAFKNISKTASGLHVQIAEKAVFSVVMGSSSVDKDVSIITLKEIPLFQDLPNGSAFSVKMSEVCGICSLVSKGYGKHDSKLKIEAYEKGLRIKGTSAGNIGMPEGEIIGNFEVDAKVLAKLGKTKTVFTGFEATFYITKNVLRWVVMYASDKEPKLRDKLSIEIRLVNRAQ